MHSHAGRGLSIALSLLFLPATLLADASDAGWSDLVARLGLENIPTGAGVVVGQVEAPSGGYGPDQANTEFSGKMFVAMSGNPGVSGHATTVGANFYGNLTSIAPDIDTIHLWEAASWLQGGFLRASTSPSAPPPLNPPANLRIFNHSWVGTVGDAFDINVLRRADFVVNRDQMFIVVGVNNGGGSNMPLMSHVHNGLAVGVLNGSHVSADTAAGFDDPGRQKPELVAPNNLTSFATPVVGAAIALLLETAATDAELADNPNADRVDTIKAVLMAGAEKVPGWINDAPSSGPSRGVATRPLDDVYGAGGVEVNLSHLILSGGEHAGSPTVEAAIDAPGHGWDFDTLGVLATRYWRFSVVNPADEVSIAAAWNRFVPAAFNFSALGNFTLTLHRVGPQGELISLVGPAGEPYFSGGNVVSQAFLSTQELLYIRDLEPGEYALELRRIDTDTNVSGQVAVAWRFSPGSIGILGDLTGDGCVDLADLGQLLTAYNSTAGGDLDGDGDTDLGDLGGLLANYGVGCN